MLDFICVGEFKFENNPKGSNWFDHFFDVKCKLVNFNYLINQLGYSVKQWHALVVNEGKTILFPSLTISL